MAAPALLKRGLRKLAKTAIAVGDFPFGTMPGPRILIYHQVGAALGRQMEVTLQAFAAHLEWLHSNGTIVSLDEALRRADEPESHRLFVLTFDDGYLDMYTNAFPLLRDRACPFTVYVTTEPVETQVGTVPDGGAEPLTWDQLAEMADNGATIGSHTHTHPDLRAISTDEIEDELSRSDDLILRRLGIAPEHFCFPYGYWSVQADPLIRNRYKTATLGAGQPITGETDPHLVPRVPIQLSDGEFFFRLKMTSGMKREEWVRRRISGYKGVDGE